MHRPARQPLLRPGLLDGQVVAVAGRAGGLGRAAAAACGELGAHVEQLGDEGHRVDLLDEPAVRTAIGAIAAPERGLHTVVIDAASAFAADLSGGPAPCAAADPSDAADSSAAADSSDAEPLRRAGAAAWVVARAAATEVMIEGGGGKLVILAPAPQAGPHAGALRAALENLARTLSIEWSRHAIRATTLAPGRETRADELAALVAYLASPAGDYFSGCRLSLGETER